MMRVTGGDSKGRWLRPPISGDTRPTSALVRAAIFNVLASRLWEDVRVLDLYAGTGSLGIEALSRGAQWADFVEMAPRQCAALRENLKLAGLEDRAKVYCISVEKALGLLEGPYGVVLLDPPYRAPGLDATLESLALGRLLAEDAVVVVEHSKHTSLKECYGKLAVARSHRYGDTVVDMLTEGGVW
jgi:16S rRNA (guanine966-N2)-methyltransferase